MQATSTFWKVGGNQGRPTITQREGVKLCMDSNPSAEQALAADSEAVFNIQNIISTPSLHVPSIMQSYSLSMGAINQTAHAN